MFKMIHTKLIHDTTSFILCLLRSMATWFYRWYMVIERVGGVVLAFHRPLSECHWDLLQVVWDLFISSLFLFLSIDHQSEHLPKLLRIEKT